MGRKSPLHSITLAQAGDGMILAKQAAGRSPNTINNYQHAFAKLRLFLPPSGNPLLACITRAQLVAFFSWLETDHLAEPDGVAPRPKRKLAAKTRNNIHGGLSALWAWAVAEGIVTENLVRAIEPPQFSEPDTRPRAPYAGGRGGPAQSLRPDPRLAEPRQHNHEPSLRPARRSHPADPAGYRLSYLRTLRHVLWRSQHEHE